ncbi:Mu transposase C-terminal domain-containing protein [Sedimentitalea nanhaiensis]|uniref:Mu transposase, C-terminal n=1 Tax=Sedimentitalea nanhaiensis TaxID=999627 RepID=A0A1I7CRB0_9RHOB|nr:Mu transposase C-terminal domain-containing protein [Sedimentitalea nanhaiensis]SFU01879.1 Mu transposase, C-terminal [Sedimentitalea nanhaiensis]
MPSVEPQRKALGTRWEKTVTKKGITVLGIRYHSEVLARWFMHARSKKVRIRFYSEDIGALAVELDGKWIELPSVTSIDDDIGHPAAGRRRFLVKCPTRAAPRHSILYGYSPRSEGHHQKHAVCGL